MNNWCDESLLIAIPARQIYRHKASKNKKEKENGKI